ncbi:MAG: hypothetical protein JZU55_20830 [Afipia sp.]|jgi:hypothetical protein|nr:hypothetical protein [Afipia sp.]MCR6737126.1 hypothetical protein [Afipia sp.]
MRKTGEQKPDDAWLDQRLLEFAGIVAVVVLIAAGVHYINHAPRADTASFIVPSQTVRW